MRELAIAFGGDGLSPERLVGTGTEKKQFSSYKITKISTRRWDAIYGARPIPIFNNLETNEEMAGFRRRT